MTEPAKSSTVSPRPVGLSEDNPAVSSTARVDRAAHSATVFDQPSVWGLSPADQRFLQVSLLITAVLLGLHGWKQAARSSVAVQVVRAPTLEKQPVSVPTETPLVATNDVAPAPISTPPTVPMAEDYVHRIDINQADWPAWAQLPGIGETLARRIVAERESHGPFASIEDLRRVKGVGAKTLEKMRPHLQLAPSPR